ncbi:MAG: tRNA (N(6)-L-threonylcarbamoyladenosine(37)-C(2))-methylthiotransferase MtaB, partial [Candidatus Rokuibacteriota bacterium]
PCSYLHVFAYSDRKGTEAARLPERVPSRAIRERSRRLRELGREKNLVFRRGMIGRRREVLVLAERDRDTGLHSGLTSNYVEVVFDGPDGLARRFAPVTITGVTAEHTFAALEEATA